MTDTRKSYADEHLEPDLRVRYKRVYRLAWILGVGFALAAVVMLFVLDWVTALSGVTLAFVSVALCFSRMASIINQQTARIIERWDD